MTEPPSRPSWSKIRELLDRALDHPADERSRVVAEAADPQLERAVLSMLAAYEDETEPFARALDVQMMVGEGWREGDVIGAYRLIERVGEGGMGTVFIAQRADDAYSKKVAIKLIRRGWASEEEIRRFRSERQILADLEHPSIARLLDGGETENGQPFLVMEFVDGQPIDAYCRRQDLGLEQILGLFLEVCRAVQFAHQSLIVHRDLKPSNILVTAGDGEGGGRVKLLDFGIAKILEPGAFAEPVEKTRTGSMPMTPAYASPEQVSDQPVTTATDVYSLGMLLYLLLTGDLPYRFPGHDLPAIVEAVVFREVTAPSHRLRKLRMRTDEEESGGDPTTPRSISERTLRGDLDAIVLKALAKEPAQRYATAEQLADDLERHLEYRPVRARRDTLIYRGVKFLNRYRLGLLAAAAIFSILVLAIVTLLRQQQSLLDERNRALEQRRRAETVTGYLVELFELPDPGRSFGEQVTARELLDKSSRTIDEELADQPRLLPELLGVLAETYAGLGQLEDARHLVERALRQTRENGDEDRLPELLFDLSNVLSQEGRYEASRLVTTEALARLDGAEGPEPRRLAARCLARQGYLDTRLGRHESAHRILERALDEARALGDDEITAQVFEYLGALREIESDLEGAVAMYRQALELRRQLHDRRHPRVTQLEGMIASALSQRDPEAGEQVLRQAIEDQRRLFGGAHPMLAISTNNLALVLEKRGELDEAEALYDRALEMKRSLYGGPHPSIAATLLNLANLRARRGESDAAEDLYRQALDIFETELGDQHPDYALCLANLGKLMIDRGELAQAAPLLERARGVVLRALGPSHERALLIRTNLSEIARREGRAEQARQILRDAIADARRQDGGPPALSAALFNLASLEAALGDEEAAAELHRQVAERDGDRTLVGLYALTHAARRAFNEEQWLEAERLADLAARGFAARGDRGAWYLSAEGTRGEAMLEQGRAGEAATVLEARADLVAEAVAAGRATEASLEKARHLARQAREGARKMPR